MFRALTDMIGAQVKPVFACVLAWVNNGFEMELVRCFGGGGCRGKGKGESDGENDGRKMHGFFNSSWKGVR